MHFEPALVLEFLLHLVVAGRSPEVDSNGIHDSHRVPSEAVRDHPSDHWVQGTGQTAARGHRDRLHHGDLWRVPHRQDADMSHNGCHMSGMLCVGYVTCQVCCVEYVTSTVVCQVCCVTLTHVLSMSRVRYVVSCQLLCVICVLRVRYVVSRRLSCVKYVTCQVYCCHVLSMSQQLSGMLSV